MLDTMHSKSESANLPRALSMSDVQKSFQAVFGSCRRQAARCCKPGALEPQSLSFSVRLRIDGAAPLRDPWTLYKRQFYQLTIIINLCIMRAVGIVL